jgi:GPH family glycoside/pentoside/hexuronide:cation symporter
MGGLFTLMMSMTADVCDLDELENGLPRKEGTFGAIYWLMVKIGQSIALVLGGAILSIVGFNPDAPIQTLETMNNLRIADIIVPAGTAALAFIVMWGYKLDEDRVREIGKELERRKVKPKVLSSSGYLGQASYPMATLGLKPDSKYDLDFSNKSNRDILKLFKSYLNNGLHGICFSPYEEGQDLNDTLSEKQISRRMKIIEPYTKWVRSFSCTKGNEYIPKIAKQYGLKTVVGAWISDDRAKNNAEISNLVKLANEGMVDVAVVGNEVLLRNELTIDEVLSFIKKVREQLPSHIPVTYIDSYFIFDQHPALIKACDLLLINCYPFWEGADIEVATAYLRYMYNLVVQQAGGKPVIISETGWPNDGEATEDAKPSKLNAMKYFINVNHWAEKEHIKVFYFSSFDESWKIHHEGDVGQRWGLWDKHENLKYK